MGGLNILDFILLGIVLIIVLISIRKMKKMRAAAVRDVPAAAFQTAPGEKKTNGIDCIFDPCAAA